MPDQPVPKRYRSYLLRLWKDAAQPRAVWRFSLDDPHTGQRTGFADMEKLLGFLQAVMQSSDLKEEE